MKNARKDDIARTALSWRGALFVVVMMSLIISLATRTFHRANHHQVGTQANTVQAVRQHMVRDAVPWTPPVFTSIAQQVPVFSPHIQPIEPSIPAVLLIGESLSNRPPPVR